MSIFDTSWRGTWEASPNNKELLGVFFIPVAVSQVFVAICHFQSKRAVSDFFALYPAHALALRHGPGTPRNFGHCARRLKMANFDKKTGETATGMKKGIANPFAVAPVVCRNWSLTIAARNGGFCFAMCPANALAARRGPGT